MGHVSGYEDAGIEYAEIVAVMDDRTSPICRHLNGRIIPVSAMSAQRDQLLAASKSRSIAAAKKAQPMLSATSGIGLDVLNTTKTGQIIEQGIGFLSLSVQDDHRRALRARRVPRAGQRMGDKRRCTTQ